MLNQCTLTGNLGADPEVFYSSEGNPVASFYRLPFRKEENRMDQGRMFPEARRSSPEVFA